MYIDIYVEHFDKYLPEAIRLVASRTMNENWMEKDCITFFHLCPNPVILFWIIVLYSMIHFVDTALVKIKQTGLHKQNIYAENIRHIKISYINNTTYSVCVSVSREN